MRNKGFTLVELLSVIVILGIIFSIATVSYVVISDNIHKKMFEAKKKLIENAAIEWESDNKKLMNTGISSAMVNITVQDLIDGGYLSKEDTCKDESGNKYSCISNNITGEDIKYKKIKVYLNNFVAYAKYDESVPEKLFQQILVDNGGIETIKEKDSPTFSELATTNEGMFATEDDLGTSYYFRGAVDNNWVIFGEENGEPIYWRIIRIDGKGNIKVIYNGVIGNTTYYGELDSSDDVNYQKSNVYKVINTWYETNLFNSNINEFISEDAIYCSDRNSDFTTYSDYLEDKNIEMYRFDAAKRIISNEPSLKCNQINDQLNFQNKSLEYPIGLITGDEVMLAGGGWDGEIGKNNKAYYLHLDGQDFWTMSPYGYSVGNGIDIVPYEHVAMVYVYSEGAIDMTYTHSEEDRGIRPVISLKKDILFNGGDGSYEKPYIIK